MPLLAGVGKPILAGNCQGENQKRKFMSRLWHLIAASLFLPRLDGGLSRPVDNQCQFRHFQPYLTGLIVLPNKSLANIARFILESADNTRSNLVTVSLTLVRS
jgi:hypothetical protein